MCSCDRRGRRHPAGMCARALDQAVVAFDRQQQRGLTTRLLSTENMALLASPWRVLVGATPHRE